MPYSTKVRARRTISRFPLASAYIYNGLPDLAVEMVIQSLGHRTTWRARDLARRFVTMGSHKYIK
jgi:hypothetical protein